jgi:hypothetical protein
MLRKSFTEEKKFCLESDRKFPITVEGVLSKDELEDIKKAQIIDGDLETHLF